MLRATNPSPYMYLFNFENEDGEAFQIVGSSPEALVTVNDSHVVTHPIAGSRPRGANYEEDQLHYEKSLLADEKERAEHLMLVDLSRNDLSRVCQAGTVEVTQFMEVERFSHIMHLVSNVVGKARADVDAYDVLASTFPAGTLSGAPKPRALQLLDQYEPYRRGVYGGVVGYLDFAGDMDMAIAIRSALLKDGRAYVQAGGGIVNDSNFADEALETVNKAAAPLRAVYAAARCAKPKPKLVKASEQTPICPQYRAAWNARCVAGPLDCDAHLDYRRRGIGYRAGPASYRCWVHRRSLGHRRLCGGAGRSAGAADRRKDRPLCHRGHHRAGRCLGDHLRNQRLG